MEKEIYKIIQAKNEQLELTKVVSWNQKTEQFGLSLTKEDAHELIISRNESLKKYQRVEFGKGILDKVIFTFCDSKYIHQGNYLESLQRFQDIFYQFKNASEDKLTDDELLKFMQKQFETVCFGDLEYLESTVLERFTRAIRSGYTGYQKDRENNEYMQCENNEYEQFDEEEHWDNNMYYDVLKELFW